jgi:hypothetical protein
MGPPTATHPAAARADEQRLVYLLISALAVYWLGLGVLMIVAPHTFFEQIGPFGSYNRHYIRDNATFALAFGIGLLISPRWSHWRVPELATTSIQGVLHTVNHAVDIARADPKLDGPGDANVYDDEPAPAREWLPVYARALGARPPRRVPVFLARLVAGKSGARGATEMRGASNAKARAELGWTARYRSWREAFAALSTAPPTASARRAVIRPAPRSTP